MQYAIISSLLPSIISVILRKFPVFAAAYYANAYSSKSLTTRLFEYLTHNVNDIHRVSFPSFESIDTQDLRAVRK